MKTVDYDGLAEWIGYAEESVAAVLIPLPAITVCFFRYTKKR